MIKDFLKILIPLSTIYSLLFVLNPNVVQAGIVEGDVLDYYSKVVRRCTEARRMAHDLFKDENPRYPPGRVYTWRCDICRLSVGGGMGREQAYDKLRREGKQWCVNESFYYPAETARNLEQLWGSRTRQLLKPYLVTDQRSLERWNDVFDGLLRRAREMDGR